jgi:hypothetical protein
MTSNAQWFYTAKEASRDLEADPATLRDHLILALRELEPMYKAAGYFRNTAEVPQKMLFAQQQTG